MSTYLVIGGTGKTGRRVVDRLAAAGNRVRAASRATGFDWADPRADLTGVDGVFLTVPGQDPRNPERVAKLLDGYRGRTVLLSARAVEFHPAGALAQVEAAVPGTILRPTWFVQNFTEGFLQPVDGVVTAPTGDGREPFVDLEDVADVAVAALTRPGHEGRTYELSGPEALTFAEAAERLGARFAAADPRAYAASLELPPEYVAWRMAMFDAIREGRDARVSGGVEDALGRPARAFGRPTPAPAPA